MIQNLGTTDLSTALMRYQAGEKIPWTHEVRALMKKGEVFPKLIWAKNPVGGLLRYDTESDNFDVPTELTATAELVLL